MQDILFGQSSLDLDRELNRLQETREIVMFKFNTSGCDAAVTLQSEFQKVLQNSVVVSKKARPGPS